MAVPVDVVFQNFPRSDAVEAAVREKVDRMERFHQRITSCRVVLEQIQRRHHRGKLYGARVDILVPGGEIVASRNPGSDHAHEDVYVAIRDSFRAATRMIEDHVRKRSGHRTKVHPAPAHGNVVRLFAEEGYGFIAAPDGSEIYFQRNAVPGQSWDRLTVGATVHFTAVEGEKGLHAVTVSPVASADTPD